MKSAIILLALIVLAGLLFGRLGVEVALIAVVAWMYVLPPLWDAIRGRRRRPIVTRPDPVPGVTGETLIAMDARATHRKARIWEAQRPGSGS